MSEIKTTNTERVSTVSDKVSEAMARIEAEARAKYITELEAEGIEPKGPIEMNTSQLHEPAEEDLSPATSIAPNGHIPALRGDIKRVDRPFKDRNVVPGPSAAAMAKGAKREAQVQLERLQAEAEAKAAKEQFTPEKLHADLQAKTRIISKMEKKLNAALKRLDQLEKGEG